MLKKIRLTKVSDDHFEGNHPNGIYTGYVKEGMSKLPPVVGERFYCNSGHIRDGFSTSTVMEIIDDNTFKSRYSTYKIELLDEDLAHK